MRETSPDYCYSLVDLFGTLQHILEPQIHDSEFGASNSRQHQIHDSGHW